MGSVKLILGGTSKIGDRKHIEECTVGKFDKKDIFLAVLDGHGGKEAVIYARDNLWDNIKSAEGFYSDKPEEIVEAIKAGFKRTQDNMLGKPPFLLYTLPTSLSRKNCPPENFYPRTKFFSNYVENFCPTLNFFVLSGVGQILIE